MVKSIPGFTLKIILCILGIVAITTMVYSNETNLVVTCSAVNVRENPSTTSAILGVIHKGEILISIAQSGKWHQISFKEKVGWVSSSCVAKTGIEGDIEKENTSPISQIENEIDLPFTKKPNSLQSDDLNRFYIDFGNEVYRWTTREDMVFRYYPPSGWGITISHQVSPVDGTIHSLKEISRTECNDRECKSSTNHYRLYLVKCSPNGACRENEIASWSVTSGAKSYTTYSASIRVTEKGTLLYLLTRTDHRPKDSHSETNYFCGSSRCDAVQWENQYFNEMKGAPKFRINGNKDDFYGPGIKSGGITSSISSMSERIMRGFAMIDRSTLYDLQGRPHIFFYNPSGRRFTHMYVQETGNTPQKKSVVLDEPESGTTCAAVRSGKKGAAVFHYFYRNAFYKGVKVSIFDDAISPPTQQFVIDSSSEYNPGWDLMAASTLQGRILLGYQRDPVHFKKYRLRLFSSVQTLMAAQKSEPKGWEKKYTKWFGMAGAGAWYAMWYFDSAPPDKDVPSENIFKPKYKIAPSILAEGSVEARYDRYSLGASYIKGFINEKIKDTYGKKAQTNFDYLFGLIGWDRILAYHDVRVGVRFGQMTTQYKDQFESRVIDTKYQRYDAFFLNTWRIRYGLFFQTYDSYMPFYVWKIPTGEKQGVFVDSFTEKAKFNDVGLTIGYSRLDYAVKYEIKTLDWFIDGDVGIGYSQANLAETHKVEGHKIKTPGTVMFPFNLEVGGIYYKRFYSLHGFGWFVRGGYRTEGNYTGINSAPKKGEDEDPAKEDEYSTTFNRIEIRHGPFFNTGMVF